MAKPVLIVEDDRNIADLLRLYLEKEGYEVDIAYDGPAGVEKFRKRQPALVLLDVMLPGIDGFELMEYFAPKEIPVIFITARDSVKDRIRGLKLGADDYIVKPFEIAELLARVETVLRRYHKTQDRLEIGGISVDLQSRRVYKEGEPVGLTAKEYSLLILFLQNRNIALFRETIYERVWESEYMGDSRTVDLHVQRLRRKLGWQERIVAVYKVGYRLEDHGL